MAKKKQLLDLGTIDNELIERARESVKNKQTVVPETDHVSQSEQAEPTRLGRPKRLEPSSIIPRKNGRTLYLEPRRNMDLSTISLRNAVDKQDVIRTALDVFLDTYMEGDCLNDEGERLVLEYYRRTHRH